MNLSDKQVFEAIREGNETAFEMLFKSYYQPLCRYAYSYLNDKDEAEEIVQSTFILLWDKRKQIDIHSSTRSYLYRMVRNSCLNSLKHEKVKQQHAKVEISGGEPVYEGATQPLAYSELEKNILEAMKDLPEQCRLVFQLSRFEELKYSEIAEQLDISVKTVENHMGKALKIMRERLKDYLPLFILFVSDLI